MFNLPDIDTGVPELDGAFATLMQATTAVQPISIPPAQARALLRVIADTAGNCTRGMPNEYDGLCSSCAASARIKAAGDVLLKEFFNGGNG